MAKQIIVLIGSPGSGKTTVINQLQQMGYICYPEISREIIQEAQKQGVEQLFLENPLLFSELLLEGRKKQFQKATQEPAPYVFLDRGIPDVLAYMHYIGDAYPPSFDHTCITHPYTTVFILPPWEAIYISDNERYETFQQAQLIHNHLVETYTHYGYSLIEVPKDTLHNRVQFILNHLK